MAGTPLHQLRAIALPPHVCALPLCRRPTVSMLFTATPLAAEKFDEWFQMGENKEGEAEVVQQLHKARGPHRAATGGGTQVQIPSLGVQPTPGAPSGTAGCS